MAKKRDTVEAIIQAARQEFLKNGLAGARIDRIAAVAKVNKAMIYYHFKSKEDLYQTILDTHLNRIKTFFRERIVLLDNAEDIFRNLSEFYNTQLIEIGIVPLLLREIADGGERLRKTFGDFFSEGPALKLKSIIKTAIENGEFRDIPIEHAIASFIGMNLYYIIMSPMVNKILEIKDEAEFKKQRAEAVCDLFLNGIKAR